MESADPAHDHATLAMADSEPIVSLARKLLMSSTTVNVLPHAHHKHSISNKYAHHANQNVPHVLMPPLVPRVPQDSSATVSVSPPVQMDTTGIKPLSHVSSVINPVQHAQHQLFVSHATKDGCSISQHAHLDVHKASIYHHRSVPHVHPTVSPAKMLPHATLVPPTSSSAIISVSQPVQMQPTQQQDNAKNVMQPVPNAPTTLPTHVHSVRQDSSLAMEISVPPTVPKDNIKDQTMFVLLAIHHALNAPMQPPAHHAPAHCCYRDLNAKLLVKQDTSTTPAHAPNAQLVADNATMLRPA